MKYQTYAPSFSGNIPYTHDQAATEIARGGLAEFHHGIASSGTRVASMRNEADGMIVMRGLTGEHRILTASAPERIAAHWKAFAEANAKRHALDVERQLYGMRGISVRADRGIYGVAVFGAKSAD
jgi:hypothetical protein